MRCIEGPLTKTDPYSKTGLDERGLEGGLTSFESGTEPARQDQARITR